ncbi:Uncharacterized protein HZ326_29618 [Fusarium oxysporum f. sp. albedinis]|nr:Uncharacterized protein HZ326_29618 [Fusarium oxysporum f. sp. albedinis]
MLSVLRRTRLTLEWFGSLRVEGNTSNYLHFSTRWSNRYTSNAITHAQNRHRQLIQASETSRNLQQSTQPSIDSYIAL